MLKRSGSKGGGAGSGARARGSGRVLISSSRSSIERLSATRVQRSAPLQSTGQRWRLVNEACIVDLLDKKVRDVGARDEAGAPVACIHKHAIRTCAPPVGQDS